MATIVHGLFIFGHDAAENQKTRQWIIAPGFLSCTMLCEEAGRDASWPPKHRSSGGTIFSTAREVVQSFVKKSAAS
jgi:hypothetical protein